MEQWLRALNTLNGCYLIYTLHLPSMLQFMSQFYPTCWISTPLLKYRQPLRNNSNLPTKLAYYNSRTNFVICAWEIKPWLSTCLTSNPKSTLLLPQVCPSMLKSWFITLWMDCRPHIKASKLPYTWISSPSNLMIYMRCCAVKKHCKLVRQRGKRL